MRLTNVIADREARIATNAARVIELNALIAADEAELAALDPADDAARITLLTERIAARQNSVSLITRNAELEAINATQTARIITITYRGNWRYHPESNRGTRICNPVRHHSAMVPRVVEAVL